MADWLLNAGIDAMERGLVPDAVVRAAIRHLLRRRLRVESSGDCEEQNERFQQFLDACHRGPIACLTEKANEQHYEVPAAFFRQVLGRHLKYSCCCFEGGAQTLDEAEARALTVTCERAGLSDGQRVLELGCGWGSLSLWMAERYPHSSITAVSNSASQRDDILKTAESRGLKNIDVITANINDFQPPGTFDRVVSVEMFEHMRNYELLLSRIAAWLNPRGRLFVHIFCHRGMPYFFETEGSANWMGRYFFSGGTMPSDDLFAHFQRDLRLIRRWRWNGRHYERTANEWLKLQDRQRASLIPVLRETYGADADRWFHRWRMFFMSCAELFGFNDGNQWWVSHYLFEKP